MTVRGGKNRVLVYVGAVVFLVAIVLLYHNAATRLDESKKTYEKCHLNEESLSAQLQVILEYKIRLEKSLQQEKSDHAQTKEDMRNKVEEERISRERENLESINKFTALQQQYKLLQSQHEDVNQELEKSKQQLLSDEEERSHLDTQVTALTQQVKLIQEGREADNILLKGKISDLKAENEKLKKNSSNAQLFKEKADLQRELSECLRNHSPSVPKKSEEAPAAPNVGKRPPTHRSSTAASKVEVVSGAAFYINTSTPLINPLAVQTQDTLNLGLPLPLARLVNIPALPEYKEQQQPIVEQEVRPRPQIPLPVNEIPRNHVYNYQAEYDKESRKEDDDDVDQIDYPNEKPAEAIAEPAHVLIQDKHDSIMVNPK